MSLRTLAAQASDRSLRAAILNSFALLTDAQIFEVCTEICGMTPAAASDTIIDLLGPESARVASILPSMWAPASLADADIASKVVIAAGNFATQSTTTKAQVEKALSALDLTAQERHSVHIDLEKTAVSAIDFAMIGRLLASGVVALLQRRVPMLKYAENIPGLIRLAGTAAGAAFGARHEVETEREQQLLPPQSR